MPHATTSSTPAADAPTQTEPTPGTGEAVVDLCNADRSSLHSAGERGACDASEGQRILARVRRVREATDETVGEAHDKIKQRVAPLLEALFVKVSKEEHAQ